MTLYEKWLKQAYNERGESVKAFWDGYMPIEQKAYEIILQNKESKIEGTIKELSSRFHMETFCFAGFIDGVNEATENQIDLKTVDEDSFVVLKINFENLYRKMIEYKAEHLYLLKQWEEIFSEAELKAFYMDEKTKNTIVKPIKIGRNDPCTCGSGKKYKVCCGK